MDSSKKPNKIREIVRLHQILKKWRKLANSSSSSSKPSSIQYILKKTLSFSDNDNTTATTSSFLATSSVVPKGYLAVSVGEAQKRFVIPTEYLSRRAFRALLREAEEEFGFEQIGVLRIPCEVSVFERILEGIRLLDNNNSIIRSVRTYDDGYYNCCTSESQLGLSHHSDHSPMCR